MSKIHLLLVAIAAAAALTAAAAIVAGTLPDNPHFHGIRQVWGMQGGVLGEQLRPFCSSSVPWQPRIRLTAAVLEEHNFTVWKLEEK